MACDLSLCFLAEGAVPIEAIARSKAIQAAEAAVIHLAVGVPQDASGGKAFFGLWTMGRVDLTSLAAELSLRTAVCIVWKAEHGGVAGCLAYRNGEEVSNMADSGEDYLLLPSRGFEEAFGIVLPLDSSARLVFPEMLLDESVSCFRIEGAGTRVEPAAAGTLTALLEDDLNVEPVLPVEV